MIILIDTSTPVCKLSLIDGDWRYDNEWLAARSLARDLLGYLRDQLAIHGKTWSDISAIGVYEGPGSFTGLRMSLTVMNTLADSLAIPIVGASGDDWQSQALAKLKSGQNQRIVLPQYGSEAHITISKK